MKNLFNVTKRWNDSKEYLGNVRGISRSHALLVLESIHEMELCKIAQDCDLEIDFENSTYPSFKVVNNGVVFTYAIEEDYIFNQMADFLKPKPKLMYPILQN